MMRKMFYRGILGPSHAPLLEIIVAKSDFRDIIYHRYICPNVLVV